MIKFSKLTKRVESLSEDQLLNAIGGARSGGGSVDGIDVSSELASGGTTTDTYEASDPGPSFDSIDVSSELASGGTTTDTYE